MQAAGLEPVKQAALLHYLQEVRRALHPPGLSLAVVQGNQIVSAHGPGMASRGRAMTQEILLIIGSLSKGITANAVMQLVEDGKLDLDARVVPIFPGSGSLIQIPRDRSPFVWLDWLEYLIAF